MKMRLLSILAAIAVIVGTAQAQTIYKCADGKGGTAYQQIPCAKEAQTKSVRSFRPESDAPHDYGQYQRESNQFQGEVKHDQARAQQPRRETTSQRYDPNPMSADAEALRRLENMAGSREGRALLRQMSGQSLQRSTAPDPNQGVGQPVRVIDQRTSMPIEGAIKVAPNRIWDPKTGEYHWTTP